MHKTRGYAVTILSAIDAQNAICREQESLREKISKAAEKNTGSADDSIMSLIDRVIRLGKDLKTIKPNKTYAIIEITPEGGKDGE